MPPGEKSQPRLLVGLPQLKGAYDKRLPKSISIQTGLVGVCSVDDNIELI